jgi:hypothetical protein
MIRRDIKYRTDRPPLAALSRRTHVVGLITNGDSLTCRKPMTEEIPFRIFSTAVPEYPRRTGFGSDRVEYWREPAHLAARRAVQRLVKKNGIRGLSRTVDASDGDDAATMAVYRLPMAEMAKLMLVLPPEENILLDRDLQRALSRKKFAEYLLAKHWDMLDSLGRSR